MTCQYPSASYSVKNKYSSIYRNSCYWNRVWTKMATDCKGYSQATKCLKIGTLVLLIAVVLHIVGFSTANWSFISLKRDENLSVSWMPSRESHEGLWSICVCILLNFKICSCFGRQEEPGMKLYFFLFYFSNFLFWIKKKRYLACS